MTTRELAELLNVSQSYVSSIENSDKRVTEEILTRYIKAFKISKKTLKSFDKTSNALKLKTQDLLLYILAKICDKSKIQCEISFLDEDKE